MVELVCYVCSAGSPQWLSLFVMLAVLGHPSG